MSDRAAAPTDDEALLRFIYMCPVGLLRTTANGDVQMINPEAAQLLLPLARKPILQNLFDALESCAPDLRDMAERFSAASGSICDQHRMFVSRSGRGPRVIALSLLKINADCLMAVLQDVTKQVELERQNRQNEAMFAALVSGVHDFALVSLDRNGRIDSWNQSCERQTGFKAAEVLGHDLGALSLPGRALADNVGEQVAEAARTGWSLRERWCARREGARYWCQIMVAADRELDNGVGVAPAEVTEPRSAPNSHAPIDGFAVVLRDVTERRVTGEQLRQLLTTDYLTGATNRGHFFELAEIEFARHRQQDLPIAALMLDLDHFKAVNDCFGHAAGDVVLKRLVEVCRAQLRVSDVLARMGGEEFAVMLPDTTLAEAQLIAERICRSVPADIELPPGGCLGGTPWQSGKVGVSIGCAAINASVAGVDALLNAADAALYDAKRAGRGRVRSASQFVPASSPGLTEA